MAVRRLVAVHLAVEPQHLQVNKMIFINRNCTIWYIQIKPINLLIFLLIAPSISGFTPIAPAAAPLLSNFQPSQPVPVQNTLIQKHIYVHVPPPSEEDEFNQPISPEALGHQKHYKIIFIKAPSTPSISQQIAQAQLVQQQQTEEKTLVYVLVKVNNNNRTCVSLFELIQRKKIGGKKQKITYHRFYYPNYRSQNQSKKFNKILHGNRHFRNQANQKYISLNIR